ncbi:MAG: hypothetical protein C7B45_00725 [Sulfobacillus acidophilus]|uniref:Uncharacterized protein n=1 Tax=Sulfobacillus acidophilus TaxID=53633 RepID=A0A2T2WPQ8_9FIRM|nr:MAG: hypothetical protein C7B45_00725 [Sulfobacillus acidophilus]
MLFIKGTSNALDEVNEVSVEEMENLICQLPTVMKCAVSVNDWGAIEEIHVLTNLERNPKQIVRDVESALLARYHLKVDHKRISVAQIVPDEPTAESQAAWARVGRLKIYEYHLESDALNQTGMARVVFAWGESEAERVTGEWSGRYLPSQHHQIMAWAAVDAINRIPGLIGPIVLSECRTVTLANRTVVLVGLSQYDRRRRETLLVGAAEDRGDSHGASVRAVLDAVNRKVAPFIGLEDVHAKPY